MSKTLVPVPKLPRRNQGPGRSQGHPVQRGITRANYEGIAYVARAHPDLDHGGVGPSGTSL